ncbi:cell wall-active antibiotics response protein LiaF [Oceanobacillus saliphilus]|uniref:cell wall-active antibiotics response protein LiaF n=1 Tax=Oceanobacillus saliphilus TaxID=2925834 RepID=UPI00201E173E|nr:cell wall-active antibiotics response protein LiaF [Oceanobacillus saliphilus]
MFKRLSTDYFNWILIIGVILFIFEIAFFYGGTIIPALFSALFMYIGWKYFNKLWGKILFWISLVSLVFAILNLMAVRFLIIAAVVLFIIHYSKAKKEAEYDEPILPSGEIREETLIEITPLFDQNYFGDQVTEDTAYQWKDVNINGIFGDRIIDLSNTVLPNDTAVISIRHFIGNIEIYVPYEVEVSIHHSSIFGRAHILGKHEGKLMNRSLFYQTEKYDKAYPRVKIITSLLSGDIEVKRI